MCIRDSGRRLGCVEWDPEGRRMSLCHCALDGKAMDEDAEKVQLRLEAMRTGELGRGEVKGGGLGNISLTTRVLLSNP